MNQKGRSTTSSSPIRDDQEKSNTSTGARASNQIAPDVYLCCFERAGRTGHDPSCVHAKRANRLAMAIKRAKGRCEARFPLENDCHTRCIGSPVGPFYTSDGRVRMLCDECWEAAADYQQQKVARRWPDWPGSETK